MIRHRTARRIASEWHGGITSDLYLLTSTGTISTDAEREIGLCMMALESQDTYRDKDHKNLFNLLQYVRHYGPRGPVDGWSRLSW